MAQHGPAPTEPATAAAPEVSLTIPVAPEMEIVATAQADALGDYMDMPRDKIDEVKLALVEACINAAEHSLSPDRKIYQRFRVEDDKLIVTVASRGVVPGSLASQNGEGFAASEEKRDEMSRRGWGLKLIQTLMDEVEFERVDDGTQLRMIKYRR